MLIDEVNTLAYYASYHNSKAFQLISPREPLRLRFLSVNNQ